MIELTVVAFVAGILTVLAPCILPLLPIIIGGSALQKRGERSIKHPVIITASLAVSVIVFTLLLKATTVLLGVPTQVWSIISGGIVLFFGISLVYPGLWEKLIIVTGLQAASSRLMGKSQGASGIRKDILLGAALGPVFNSCSPTYALIVAVVLPNSFTEGLLYLIAYTAGLSMVLLLIGIFGGMVADRLRWLTNPSGLFKKIIGVIFVIVGIAVIFGLDKDFQTFVLENGWYDPVMKIEESFR